MRKEELLKQLTSIKAPEPDEETVLNSQELLIKKVRISFPQIVQQRRVIHMKNYRKRVAFATVAVVVAAVILSAVIVPTIRVANAKQVAQNVIEDTLHLKVDGKDITVQGDVATAIINDLKISVDTSKAIILDVVRTNIVSLTEEEKNKAIEIFKNSPEVKSTLEEQGNVEPSTAEILEIKGLAFPDGRKYVWIKVRVDSKNGDTAGGIVDLQKNQASIDVIGPSDSVVAPGIEDYIPEAPAP
ncbi:MAG: hypothetical protein ACP5SB_05590 [Caldisericaceae bacterium]